MLPQPNFGRDKGPIEPEKDAKAAKDEKPRTPWWKKLFAFSKSD